MSQYEQNLIGSFIPLMEVDDEESRDIYESELYADILDIVDHLGNSDFKFIYLNLYDEIRNTDMDRKKELCEKLEVEFAKIYNFEFTPKLTFDSEEDIEKYLNFIEFIEYDNIDFLASLISGLDFSLLKKNVNEFISTNWVKINEKIDNLIENKKISELISLFLRTNNKEGILEFIQLNLEKNKMLVILKTMEGEFQNEWNYN